MPVRVGTVRLVVAALVAVTLGACCDAISTPARRMTIRHVNACGRRRALPWRENGDVTDAMFPLVGTSWLLGRLDDATASVGSTPTGEEVMTFAAGIVSDNHQNAAAVQIAPDVLRFGRWANGAVGVVYINSPGPARLTLEEYRFLFLVLSDDASWSITDQGLVISKREVGSATFVATDEVRL